LDARLASSFRIQAHGALGLFRSSPIALATWGTGIFDDAIPREVALVLTARRTIELATIAPFGRILATNALIFPLSAKALVFDSGLRTGRLDIRRLFLNIRTGGIRERQRQDSNHKAHVEAHRGVQRW